MSRALLFCDSFDHWDMDSFKWALYTPGSFVPTFPAEGRTGNCYKNVASNGGTFARIGQNLFAPKVRGLAAFALKLSAIDEFHPFSYLFSVHDGNTVQWSFNVQLDGTMRVYRGTVQNGTLIASGGAMDAGQWTWLELMWEIDGTNGRILTRVNGTPAIDVTGNIAESGVNQWTSAQLFAWAAVIIGGSSEIWLEDFTLWEPGTGSPPAIDEADFPGDCTVRPRRPNGVGNQSDWTPTAGDNYANTDDVLPDSDTTVVATGTTNALDLYQIEDVGADAVILAAQVVAYARKTEEGSAQIAPVFRIGGVDYPGTAQAVPATTYQVQTWPYDVSPATGIAFTPAEFNAAESGPTKAA